MCQGAAQVGKEIILIFVEMLSRWGLDNQMSDEIRVLCSKSAYLPHAGQWAGFGRLKFWPRATHTFRLLRFTAKIHFFIVESPPFLHLQGSLNTALCVLCRKVIVGPNWPLFHKVQDAKSLGHSHSPSVVRNGLKMIICRRKSSSIERGESKPI